MSLVVRGGTVVRSLDPAIVEATDLVVDGGRIVAALGGGAGAETTIDASGCLVVPGNACAHTHLYSALATGMPYRLDPPTTFVEILRRVWWRLDRALDLDAVRASALVGGLDALLSGTTTLVDHHASPNAIDGSLDVVAETLESIGIRSVLCYETSDRDGPAAAAAGLAENRRFARAAASATRPLSRAMVGAHASFTLSDETLDALVELADRTATGLHIHVAEDGADERDALLRFGRRVVRRLADHGALDANSLLAHGVHLDHAELELVGTSGATVAHNARSNMNNGVGRAHLGALGGRVALGTDGIGADLFEESRVAYLRRRDEIVTTGPDWAVGRLAAGARFVGERFDEPLLGRLEPGAPADLVVLDAPATTPLDASNLAGHWVFGLSRAAVRDVIVGGELVVHDRRSTRVDAEEVAARAREVAARLWERLDSIDVHPFEPGSLERSAVHG